MRISQTQEWLVVAVLIVYIAFTNGFWPVRNFLSTPVGKAVGLVVVVGVWKRVSPLIALLLTVSFVRCAGMREGVDETLSHSPCPADSVMIPDQPGKCRKADGTVVDATPPPTAAAPPAAPTTPTAPPPAPTAPTMPAPPPPPPMTTEEFTPFMKGDKAGGCSFSPV